MTGLSGRSAKLLFQGVQQQIGKQAVIPFHRLGRGIAHSQNDHILRGYDIYGLISVAIEEIEIVGKIGLAQPNAEPKIYTMGSRRAAWSNGSLIRAFNRTVIPQQLASLLTEGVRQEVTFYGFRGAFKTLLGRTEYGLPENYKHEVIGHAKSALDQRYIQEILLKDTYRIMKHCHYNGLLLPPAP
ncbi:hypothetical protein [Sphingorhabdus sp. YGSMI21]|uniref:hypothetical protein n=1 Tax=Sphingorhabdus sp. YGSMI21 TaxID=2077182 RepID=UPI000C1F08C2|nr:hypothetical protein [Sphingorhabdus sp. YGSMI21]ATW04377.1 hypothetical protein CHN51_13135 [Sphingorhabdus sp. YGSMI21]